VKTRWLGRLEVSAVGLGCVGMTSYYGQADEQETIATINLALDLGVDFFDTADRYGNGGNEELLGRALSQRRRDAVVATKFGSINGPNGEPQVNGRPDYVAQACDASLRRLGSDWIDLYYLHRRDPAVAIEETVGAMGRLVEQGKVRHIGLCEVGSETLRRAHATFPITAVQSEYSLWTRNPEGGMLDVCRELGIGFVAFSPLGRGFLTGTLGDSKTFEAGDKRRELPRFSPENFQQNKILLDELNLQAANAGCKPAQLALAWLLARADFIAAIPGTKRRRWLIENTKAADLELSPSILGKLDALFQPAAIKGDRNAAAQMTALEG